MTTKFWRLASAFVALTGILLFSLPGTVGAVGGNGLRVSPVRPPDFIIEPGKSYTVNITVTNITTEPADLQVVINDFTASSDESGQPALLLEPGQFAPRHSLKRFVKPIPNFSLRAGEQKTIPAVISVPANATGGGYYGAIRFAPAGANAAEADQNVTLAGSVGSLILVRVPGDVTSQLSLTSFDVRQGGVAKNLFFNSKNITSVVRFQNEGNIQEQPFGKIQLKDRSDKVIAEYEINDIDPRGNILPDTIRRFETDLDKVGNFGMFKLVGNFGYGTNGQLLSASTTFYVVPFIFIVIFLAVVALLVFLVFGLPRIIRAYNERIIKQARRR